MEFAYCIISHEERRGEELMDSVGMRTSGEQPGIT